MVLACATPFSLLGACLRGSPSKVVPLGRKTLEVTLESTQHQAGISDEVLVTRTAGDHEGLSGDDLITAVLPARDEHCGKGNSREPREDEGTPRHEEITPKELGLDRRLALRDPIDLSGHDAARGQVLKGGQRIERVSPESKHSHLEVATDLVLERGGALIFFAPHEEHDSRTQISRDELCRAIVGSSVGGHEHKAPTRGKKSPELFGAVDLDGASRLLRLHPCDEGVGEGPKGRKDLDELMPK